MKFQVMFKEDMQFLNLEKIQEASLNDTIWVQDTAICFCKQQELIKSVQEINRIISKVIMKLMKNVL
jgi:hypothetical protein